MINGCSAGGRRKHEECLVMLIDVRRAVTASANQHDPQQLTLFTYDLSPFLNINQDYGVIYS